MKENRIKQKFAELYNRNEKGLITYVTAGDPDLSATVDLALTMAAAGADLIELGIPFSDPVADGPVIQQASQRALAGGFKLSGIMEAAGQIRAQTDAPLIFMTYYNPVFQYGPGRFTDHAAAAGVDGLIVPDLPIEEAGPLEEHCRMAGVSLIPLVAPVTTPKRMALIAEKADGFIYCVSVTGVTGSRKEIETDLANFTSMVRSFTNLPLAVGFGISGPELAAAAAVHCDAVVVGSAIVNIISRGGTRQQMLSSVSSLVGEIKSALRR